MKLYACVYVSDFPVAVKLRERWNRQAPPALVFTGEASHAFVHAANAAARKAGIREGMTLSQAEGRFIVSEAALEENLKLLVEPRDEEAEKQAQRELLDAALEVCPSVENSRPGLLVLDLTGLPDPHGAAGVLAHRVEQLGLPGNVAVSQNRFVAVSAARTQEGVTHVFPDQARGFLHGLPIDALPLTGQEQKTIGRWGVRTVGEFARLPQDSLAARFGQRGAILSMLAREKATSRSRLGNRRMFSKRAWISTGKSATSSCSRFLWRSCSKSCARSFESEAQRRKPFGSR